MGFRYRKSKNFGPFRLNLSKSGIGWSFGGKGFRYTKKANGGIRTTTSIPGSGMSWVKDSSQKVRPDNKVNHISNDNEIISNKKPHSEKVISTRWLIVIAFIIIIIGIFNL